MELDCAIVLFMTEPTVWNSEPYLLCLASLSLIRMKWKLEISFECRTGWKNLGF